MAIEKTNSKPDPAGGVGNPANPSDLEYPLAKHEYDDCESEWGKTYPHIKVALGNHASDSLAGRCYREIRLSKMTILPVERAKSVWHGIEPSDRSSNPAFPDPADLAA